MGFQGKSGPGKIHEAILVTQVKSKRKSELFFRIKNGIFTSLWLVGHR